MIGLHLLVLAAVVAVAAPRVLTRAGWVYRCPGLGIAAWYAALVAVLSATGAGVVWLVAPWQGADAPVCAVWRWCVQAAQGGFGVAGRLVVAGIVATGAGLAGRLVLTAVRVGRAGLAWRRRHVEMLTLAGRRVDELGATVVEHPHPAAYLVAGRRVVVTTGALAALTGPQLAAVLAHERAHAAGRHDLLLAAVRLLHQAFPRLYLFVAARSQLGRLVELRADQLATTGHDPFQLAEAMVTLASAAATPRTPPAAAVVPVAPAWAVVSGSVAATGGDALERLGRLLSPPDPLPRRQRWGIAAVVAVLALAPAGLLVAAALLPWLGACPTLTL